MASTEAAQSLPPLKPEEVQLLAAIVAGMVPILGRLPSADPLQSAPAFGPMVEQEAALALVQDITAAALRRLAVYLDQHAEAHPGLGAAIGDATRAAQCFAAQDFAAAFGSVWRSYQAIAAARAADSALPPLTEPVGGGVQPN